MRVCDQFPGDVARGGDLLDGRSAPIEHYETIHSDRWGTVYRPERIVALDVWIEDSFPKPEGELCLTESSVKALGELVGMVPGELLARTRAELEQAYITIAELKGELADKRLVDTVLARAVNDAMNEAIPAMLVGPEPTGLGGKPKRKPPPRRPSKVEPPSDAELAKGQR